MKIAVVIHAFYPDVFQEIAGYLEKVNTPIDIYITTPHSLEKFSWQDSRLQAIEVTVNLGMDVLPFLLVVEKYNLWKYDLVIKLHTKNNLNQNSTNMMRIYLDTLLTDDALSAIALSMKQHIVGLWGPLAFARHIDKLIYKNREKLERFKSITQCYYPESGVMFFAGTMFGIKGHLLKMLSAQCKKINHLIKNEKIKQSTYSDGSYVHALERFFPILVKSQAYDIGIINPREFDQKSTYTVFSDKEYASDSYERFFRLGSNDVSNRWLGLSSYIKLDYLKVVDFTKYSTALSLEKKQQLNLVAHYLFFADHLRETWRFENGFSSLLYRLIREDVFRSGTPSAYHYILRGKKEKPTIFTEVMCEELISRFVPNTTATANFFNHQKAGTDFRQILASMGNIEVVTNRKLCNETSYQPACDIQKVSFLQLIEDYVPETISARDILKLQIEHDDFMGAMVTVKNVINKTLLTPDTIEILSVCYTLKRQWDLALRYWRLYQQSKTNPNLLLSIKSNRLIQYDVEYDPIKMFGDKTSFCNTSTLKRVDWEKDKICIYTSLFGNYDDLPIIQTEIPVYIDLIAFTDRKYWNADFRWKQIICEPESGSSNLAAKKYKIFPHKYLKEYDYSLFVDANTVFTGNIDELVSMLLDSGKFTMWRHPFRTDLLKEACAIIGMRKAKPQPVIDQVRSYIGEGIPRDTGLCEGSFIWREHFDSRVVDFMEEWWRHIKMYSYRDQLSLCFLMWHKNFYPRLIDDELGTSRENIFFYKTIHKKDVKKVQKSK